MAVYVDPGMEWPVQSNWRGGWVSHLYADTPDELHRFARRIGLKRWWCSDTTQPGSALLHYDLTKGMRKKAVAAGAVEKDFKHMSRFRRSMLDRDREVEENLFKRGMHLW